MSAKREFVLKAIEEVQETNRFLDTKAGVIVMFESSLLLVFVSSLLDLSKLQLIQSFLSRISVGYRILLMVYSVGYVIALIVHVLITLQAIFPSQNPECHVKLGNFQPKRLFYLFRTDKSGRLEPPVSEYYVELAAMSDDDVTREYVFELMKLSYIRKTKQDRLALS